MKQLLLLACATLWCLGARAGLNVIATTPDLAAIAHEIGGKSAAVTSLARPVEDAHFIDAKPSFIVKLNKADALLHGGADLEAGWLSPLLAGTRNARIAPGTPGHVACNKDVPMLEIPAALDRSKGDIHAAGNPHYLVDPENAKIVAHNIAEAFARLDAASSELYRANERQFIARLDSKLMEWRARLAPFKGTKLVAYHNSWPYLARRFDLEISLFLEPKPGLPPSPAHLAGVISRMKEQKVRTILHDPYLDRKIADTVAKATGATVVAVTQFPGGVKGTEAGYIAMVDYLVDAIARSQAGN
jgi:ABC-type Zn uptake system ZnuABC Zn-binding protein ZnuA